MANTKSLHPAIAWLRGVGFISLLLAAAALMETPAYFWWFVGLAYTGIVLLAIDLFCEPWFRGTKWWTKSFATIFFVVVLWLFTAGIVFTKAPVELFAEVTDATYPYGTIRAGIAWKPEFIELIFSLKNASERNYEDLDVLVQPYQPIAAMGQLSGISDVSWKDAKELDMRQVLIKGNSGEKQINPLVLLATDAGYKVKCGKLTAGDTLKLLIAIGEVKWNPGPYQPKQDFGIYEKDYVLRTQFTDHTTYWYGHPEGNVFVPRPPVPSKILVDISYTAGRRRRKLNKQINIIKLP